MLRETVASTGAPSPVLTAPMGLKGVALDTIGGNIGVGFEPPSVIFGLEGAFTVGLTVYAIAMGIHPLPPL